MDSTENNGMQSEQGDAIQKSTSAQGNEQTARTLRAGGKRMRIKDTRKINYNPDAVTGRPYQPMYGQTRQMPYQRQQNGEGQEQNPHQYGDNGAYPTENQQNGNETGGYNQGYQRRNYNQNYANYRQGAGQGGFQQKRNFNNQGQGGNQHRRNFNNQGGGNQQNNGYNKVNYQQRKPANQKATPQKKKNRTPKIKYIPPVKYEEFVADPTAPIRLNKYLSNAGVCSRREADEFIQAGVVKVNGEIITELGTKITRQDKVSFQDQPVKIESKIYILLNKPKNCVTTSDDPQNRMTVMDLVKTACPERIYPVGRLDRNTTGVLLLTNDGEMAAKLTHPSYKKKKIYHVWLDHDVEVEDMEKLANGIELEDGEIHADAVSYASEEDKKQVGIEIHSGRNRVVRRMFEFLGYHVAKLDRVYFAGLTKKNLGRGKWRYLNEQEVNALRMGSYE